MHSKQQAKFIAYFLSSNHNFLCKIYQLREMYTEHTQDYIKKTKNLRGLSPRANYTDRAAAAGRRS